MQGTKKIFWIVTPLITLVSLFIWYPGFQQAAEMNVTSTSQRSNPSSPRSTRFAVQ